MRPMALLFLCGSHVILIVLCFSYRGCLRFGDDQNAGMFQTRQLRRNRVCERGHTVSNMCAEGGTCVTEEEG